MVNNPLINPQKLVEMNAKISGLTEDEIRELLDVKNYGNEELMSEADRDIEALLNNEPIEPNEMANNAYKQKMVNYMIDHKEDISFKQFAFISQYIESLEPIIMRNEARAMQQSITESLNATTDSLNQPLDANGKPIEQPAPMAPKI